MFLVHATITAHPQASTPSVVIGLQLSSKSEQNTGAQFGFYDNKLHQLLHDTEAFMFPAFIPQLGSQ